MVALAAAVGSAGAQETVTIAVPMAVSFPVTDVSRSTSGAPGLSTISFSNANLSPGRALRVSGRRMPHHLRRRTVRAFPPRTCHGPTLGRVGHRMERDAGLILFWARVPEQPLAAPRTSGHVDLSWTLAAPGSGIRAGHHQLTIRWKVESIAPSRSFGQGDEACVRLMRK
jgi:hypothetical protein